MHILNVSFLVPTLRREFGGCAGNMAYALSQLGGQGVLLAAAGHDGGGYLQRLKDLGVDVASVLTVNDNFTAQAHHHHRPGQQPDHGLSPRRDAAGA